MFTSTKARQALILAGGFVLQECMLREYRDYFRSKICDTIQDYFSSSYLQDYLISSELTFLVKEESDGNHSPNGMYKAIEFYLSAYAMSDASSSARKFGVHGDFDIRDDETFERRPGEDGSNPLQLTFESGEKVADSFEGIKFIWQLSGRETQRSPSVRSFNLTFPKRYKEIVFNKYLPHIVNRSIDRSKALREESRKLKLYHSKQNRWKSTTLRHHTDFTNVAMDEGKKTALIDDLVRFVERKEFYRRIGRAWKRGYLLYGPPGTGKTTLVAAMANYLKFDIYDLELTGVKSISDLRWLLTNTTSRSILVIEDIDCAMDAQCQRDGSKDFYYDDDQDKITLSGLLNTIDGLGSYQNERIVIFTTNYKDRLDAALLRPGRMDMHIYMGYCDPAGFRVLALNYLSLTEHQLFGEIDELLQKIEITPAEVAETLIRNEIAENALQGLIDVLNEKMVEIEKKTIEEMKNVEEQKEEEGEEEEEEKDEEKEKDGEKNVQMKRNNTRIVGQQLLFFMIFVTFLLNCFLLCKSFYLHNGI